MSRMECFYSNFKYALDTFTFVFKRNQSWIKVSFVEFGDELLKIMLASGLASKHERRLKSIRENYMIYQNCLELSAYVQFAGERSYIRLSGFVQWKGYNGLQDRNCKQQISSMECSFCKPKSSS